MNLKNFQIKDITILHCTVQCSASFPFFHLDKTRDNLPFLPKYPTIDIDYTQVGVPGVNWATYA